MTHVSARFRTQAWTTRVMPYRRLIIVTSLLGMCSCNDRALESKSSQYVQPVKDTNDTAIVFVHGVAGDATSTWTNAKTTSYWPKLIKSDDLFANVNVFVFDYSSHLLRRDFSIDEVAEELRAELDRPHDNVKAITKHERLVFLCHSMGGLVTMSYLKKNTGIVAKVLFLYFSGVPGNGSTLAACARLSNNPQLRDMTPDQGDRFLGNLKRHWYSVQDLREIPTYCAYEDLKIGPVFIVDFASASAYANRPIDPIPENHINIVKPESVNSLSYVCFKNRFAERVKLGRRGDKTSKSPRLSG